MNLLRCAEDPRILAYMAFCEVSQDQSPGTPAAAGDFGFKVLTSSDPAEKTKKLHLGLSLEYCPQGEMIFQVPTCNEHPRDDLKFRQKNQGCRAQSLIIGRYWEQPF